MKRLAHFSAEALCPQADIEGALLTGKLITTAAWEELQHTPLDHGISGEDGMDVVSPRLRVIAEALEGQSPSDVETVVAELFSHPKFPLYGYVRPAVATVRELGYQASLLTSLPDCVARGIQEGVGLSSSLGSYVTIDATGKLQNNVSLVCGPQRKRWMTEIAIKGPDASETSSNPPDRRVIVFGHSMEDLGMLETSTPGRAGRLVIAVCIHPTAGLEPYIQPDWETPNPDEPLAKRLFASE